MTDGLELAPDEPALRMAHAVLVALHSALEEPHRVPLGPVVFLPEMRPHELPRAAARLTRLPKPVTCIGVVWGGVWVLGAWGADEARDRASDAANRRDLHAMLAWLAQRAAPRGRPAVVEVRGAQESVRLEGSELEQWLGDYLMPLVNLNVRDHEGGGRIPDADAYVEFQPPRRGMWMSAQTR